jgi:hypothetical protein
MTGRRPKANHSISICTIGHLEQNLLFPRGTHQIFEAPRNKLLMAMRWVSLLNARMPVGGPRSWKVAKAVIKLGKALLMIELETLVTKAYRLISARIVIFREFEKLRGSAGSGDGLYQHCQKGIMKSW